MGTGDLTKKAHLELCMSHGEQTMRSYYGARAPEYGQIYLKPERQDDLAAIREWLPRRFAGLATLEVACGTGYWTQFIAPRATSVHALDAAPETLAIARARVTDPHVTFQVGDAYALPSHLGPFGAGFAGFWFSHVPRARRREFLRGLSACLLPNSRVVLLDNLYVEGSSSPISHKDSDGNTYQTRYLTNGSTFEVLKNFPTEDELHESIAELGGSAVFMHWQYYWAFEYVTIKKP
jgi:SAM-dependent methyltransferase